jgi:hypothetical protein
MITFASVGLVFIVIVWTLVHVYCKHKNKNISLQEFNKRMRAIDKK